MLLFNLFGYEEMLLCYSRLHYIKGLILMFHCAFLYLSIWIDSKSIVGLFCSILNNNGMIQCLFDYHLSLSLPPP